MEISAIFLVLAVLTLVGMYLYAPFTARAPRARQSESHEVSALKAERDRVIDSLRELDFDHSLGKIPAEDYPVQRAALLQKGADILRRLDELAPVPSVAHDAESRMELAASTSRIDPSLQTEQMLDEEIESMIAARRKQHKGRSAGFCPKCGKPVLISDKFCPACGKSLA
jgi:hypothetical protein